jgi:hypothetical protein
MVGRGLDALIVTGTESTAEGHATERDFGCQYLPGVEGVAL